MVNELPDSIADVEQLMLDADIDVAVAENKILGFTHMDVSKELMKKWALPSLLVQCALNHHATEHEGPFAIDTCIVYVANKLSEQDLPENEDDVAGLLKNIKNWQQTQCSLEQITAACLLAEEQGQEVLESLGMVDMDISDD